MCQQTLIIALYQRMKTDTTDGSSQYDRYSEAVKSALLKNKFLVLAESRGAPTTTGPEGSRIFTQTWFRPIPSNPVRATTLQTNKDSEGVVHGHGRSIGLRAFPQTKPSVFHNSVCTGLFVTRLRPNLKHLYKKFNWRWQYIEINWKKTTCCKTQDQVYYV